MSQFKVPRELRSAIIGRLKELKDGTAQTPPPLSDNELRTGRGLVGPADLSSSPLWPLWLTFAVLAGIAATFLLFINSTFAVNLGVVEQISPSIRAMEFALGVVSAVGLILGAILTFSSRYRADEDIADRVHPAFSQMFGHLDTEQLDPEVSDFLAKIRQLNRKPVIAEQFWLMAQQERFMASQRNHNISRLIRQARLRRPFHDREPVDVTFEGGQIRVTPRSSKNLDRGA